MDVFIVCVLLAIILFLSIGIIIQSTAPDGWEDENGFHVLKKDDKDTKK